jgi:hypothetical protein
VAFVLIEKPSFPTIFMKKYTFCITEAESTTWKAALFFGLEMSNIAKATV